MHDHFNSTMPEIKQVETEKLTVKIELNEDDLRRLEAFFVFIVRSLPIPNRIAVCEYVLGFINPKDRDTRTHMARVIKAVLGERGFYGWFLWGTEDTDDWKDAGAIWKGTDGRLAND